MANVFLGCPTYDGTLHMDTAAALWPLCSKVHHVQVLPMAFSLVPRNCNRLWTTALNQRARYGYKWFAMLHADVAPDAFWLDKLIEEADRHNADMMSAVSPVKNHFGATSTAVASADGRGIFCRLTQSQVRHSSWPDTFDLATAASALERLPDAMRVENVPRSFLLCNTGCFVVRIDKSLATEVSFDSRDGIQFNGQEWEPVGDSEDWIFSRRVAQAGGKVMATRLVTVRHWGKVAFDSAAIWGSPRDMD